MDPGEVAYGGVRKICLIQLGDIGDAVWMTPALSSLKAAYPQASLTLLVREGNGGLFEADPRVSAVREVRAHRGGLLGGVSAHLRFLREFRRERFDMVIDLRSDERGAWMALLSGAPVRVAQRYQGVPFWRNRMFTHLVSPTREELLVPGAAQQSFRILRGLGVEPRAEVPKIWVGKGAEQRVGELLREAGIGEAPWYSVNPFSRWIYKELPQRTWVEVVDRIWEERQFPAVIVGSPGEERRAADLVSACSATVFDLTGRTDLAELAGLLGKSRFHMGVDSAAVHIAAAVGTPTLTVYGPSDWREWAPPGELHRVVVAEGDCVPCHQKGCDGGNVSRCLEELPAEKILQLGSGLFF